ncbi:MAG: TerC/Alx family metal homeostasis membrane protein [Bdellovibrionota bacterium]
MVYFSIYEYWWFYLGFVAFVAFVLSLDLGIFHKKAHVVSVREAATWTGVWVTCALIFNSLFYFYAYHVFSQRASLMQLPGFDPALTAKNLAMEFTTGFLIEKALAIDNIFIFAVVFSYFGIPRIYQHRVLFWGIFGALIFRAVFIAIGSELMQYQNVVVFFGILLIVTGIRIVVIREKEPDLSKNFLMRQMNRFCNIDHELSGDHFLIKKDRKWFLTPLFVSLIFIEISDIIFAIDSVPAIFAITKEPLIVFTSNVFAILGLRSMYFLLSGVIEKFRYIKFGLAGVLIFVGLKMTLLNDFYDGHFPIWLSLLVIVLILTTSILASLVLDKKPSSSTKVLR